MWSLNKDWFRQGAPRVMGWQVLQQVVTILHLAIAVAGAQFACHKFRRRPVSGVSNRQDSFLCFRVGGRPHKVPLEDVSK